MKLATEFNPLILVGAWNKYIFNPDWIGKFLLSGEKIEVENEVYPIVKTKKRSI